MRQLVERSAAIDLREYEKRHRLDLVEHLPASILEILDSALGLLDSILAACHDVRSQVPPAAVPLPEMGGSSPPRRGTSVSAPTGSTKRSVLETAFVAQLELRQEHSRLAGNESATSDAILSHCDSALRATCRALSMVDQVIAKFESREPELKTDEDLVRSLAVRRAYVKFRRQVLRRGAPTPTSLHQRLREAGTTIAVLVGRPEYPLMRIGDRLLIQGLQARLIGWLRCGDDASVDTGMRIWQDLSAAIDMMMLISQRQELAAHDEATLAELERLLRSGAAPTDPAVADGLASLLGLDADLDQLIHRGVEASSAEYLAIFEQLKRDTPGHLREDPPR